MDFLPAIFSTKNKVEKEVALISNNVKKMNIDARKMGQALQTLNNNVELIKMTVHKIQNANFERPITFIKNLDLPEEYKEGLIKELNTTKEAALATLAPVKDSSEKIRGNMAVSMIKYQMMTETLNIQKNVIESGTVQVEAIKRAQELGGMSSDKIEELVRQAEEINNMTKGAIAGWENGKQQIKTTLESMGPVGKDFGVFDIS